MEIGKVLLDFMYFLNGIVWGMPAIITLVGAGLLFTLLSRGIQFRKFGTVIKNMAYKGAVERGGYKPFAIWSAVMGATVGVGNIAGVATAVHSGGPGAVFWMWVCALIGMATKGFEVTLGVWSRREEKGEVVEGGTPYYIRLLPTIGPALAVAFSLFAWISAFGIGNMVQANNVALAGEWMANQYGWDVFTTRLITGILMAFFTALVIIGGIKRLAEVSNYLVPFMLAWYFIVTLILWISRPLDFARAVAEIVKYAFTPYAVAGGAGGYTVMWGVTQAIRYGLARGLFSNEAGLGSAPNLYAFMKVDHPGRAGLYGIFEVFMDTIVVCSFTGISIVLVGAHIKYPELSGAALAFQAFYEFYGMWVPIVLGVALGLFAYTTLLTWSTYGEVNFKYFFSKVLRLPEKPVIWFWRILWIVPIIPASISPKLFEIFWDFADTMNGLMMIPNIIAVAYFAPVAMKLIEDFVTRFSGKG
ncbi:MAG: amino acid carrier protein [Desulfurococcaceae archaeon]